jgi:hypothetical protein
LITIGENCFSGGLNMQIEEFRSWLNQFPPEVLRNEPVGVVIQVFLGEMFLEGSAVKEVIFEGGVIYG